MLLLCALTLPAFSSDVAEHASSVVVNDTVSDAVIVSAPTAVTKIGSCGAEFGCDVSELGSADGQLHDHDALLAELAASLSAE